MKAANKFLEELRSTINENEKTNADILINKGDLPYYPFQREGVDVMKDGLEKYSRFINGDDMGLGKTLQALGTVKELDKEGTIRALIICPKGAKPVWKMEIEKWLKEEAEMIVSSEGYNTCAGKLLMPQKRFTICNYEHVREFPQCINANTWNFIIFDEAHKLRNRSSGFYRGAKKICNHFAFSNILFLTGTPLVNTPKDLFSLLSLIDPTLFTSERRFIQAYFNYNQFDKTYTPWNPTKFKEMMSQYMIRRMKSDVLDLPKIIPIDTPVELEGDQLRIYKAIRDAWMAEMKDKSAILITALIAQITRLRQICLSHYLIAGVESCEGVKTGELIDILEESAGKTVVCSQFASYARPLKKRLEQEGHVVGLIDGTTSEKDREHIQREFQNPKSPMNIALLTSAGGESITLTEGNQFIHMDKPWTAAAEDQQFSRIQRNGQTGIIRGNDDEPSVIRRSIYAMNTVEQYIEQVIDRKRNMESSTIPIADVRRIMFGEE